MQEIVQVQRYYNLVFIGLLYLRIVLNMLKSCDKCQRVGNIERRNEMPMNYSLPVEPFDVWGFDFMGPFLASKTKHTHILVGVDYVTKWVEEIPTKVQIMPQQ